VQKNHDATSTVNHLLNACNAITEESYTSKGSFLDNEPLKKHERYMGKRLKRGLFRSASGKLYDADVNGLYNIFYEK
jgi:transposase